MALKAADFRSKLTADVDRDADAYTQVLAAFKLPDRFEFIPAFPQTGVGKVSRKHLREAIQALYFGAEAQTRAGTDARG